MPHVFVVNGSARSVRPSSRFERVGKSQRIRARDLRTRRPLNVRIPDADLEQLRGWCEATGAVQQDVVERWLLDDLVRRGFPLEEVDLVSAGQALQVIKEKLPLARTREAPSLRQQLNVRLTRRLRSAVFFFCRSAGLSQQEYVTDVVRSGLSREQAATLALASV